MHRQSNADRVPLTQDSLSRSTIQDAIGRVAMFVDDECEQQYPALRFGAVAIDLTNGQTLQRRVLGPKGENTNPLADADLKHKLRVNCAPLIGADGCETVLNLVWNFDQQPSPLDQLVQAISPAHNHLKEEASQ